MRDIQVLSPMYRGPAGVVALNEVLAGASQSDVCRLTLTYGDHTFRAGDKVMSVRNNYDKGPSGVFNGDLGTVVAILPETGQARVEFTR